MMQATTMVFVVDDDISIRESLEALLRKAGWCVRHLFPLRNSSRDLLFSFQTALSSTLPFLGSTVLIYRSGWPSSALECRSYL